MAWEEDRHERTERATPRRREEARKKGQVAKSREVASAGILFAGMAIFYFSAGWMVQALGETMARFIRESGTFRLTQTSVETLLDRSLKGLTAILFPFVLLPILGILISLIQIGVLFTAEPLKPNLSRINPIEGLKRLLSPSSLAELIKGVAKLLLIGYVAYWAVGDEMEKIGVLTDTDTITILTYLGSAAFRVFIKTSWVLIVIAIADYAFQRWELERNLRMTKQEVKEEFKEAEGNPLIKSRIRSLQRELARRRMLGEVPKATVVVTNPVHLAVAIRYEQGRMAAPVVVAKGAGLIAERIKEIATEHNIPVVENRSLAQVLYRKVDVGREIPVSLYRAVAELLAYIYSLRRG